MTAGGGLRWVVAGQFIGGLADNALLLVAIEALVERHAPDWTAPALRVAFYAAFVLLSAHASALADAWPKRRVLLAIHLLKLAGCLLLATGASPLWAYALVGMGAAAHAPARYGILSELSGRQELVAANAWLEGATVLAMLLGTVWGSLMLQGFAVLPLAPGSRALEGTATLCAAYLAATLCAWRVPRQPAVDPGALRRPGQGRAFAQALAVLWRDRAARLSLASTCAFWATAAVLQFVVLRWAVDRLGLTLAGAGLLQAAVACGMIAGAAAAGRWLRERHATASQPLGVVLGGVLLLLAHVEAPPTAAALLFVAGVLAGCLVVPLNAVLQGRGRVLSTPARAIGAQNFSENLASLAGLASYGLAVLWQAPLQPTVLALGTLLVATMVLIALQWRCSAGEPPTRTNADTKHRK